MFLRALSPRETAALSAGLIPAVQATPSLSLHLLPAGLRTFRCDRHARRNAEKPGSICPPPALPRLVNILHAVGAGRVLRKSPVGPKHHVHATMSPPRLPSNAWRRERDGIREDEKVAPYSTAACIDRASGYIFSHGSSQDFIANGKCIFAVRSEVGASNMQYE